MTAITITPELTRLLPDFAVGVIEAEVRVNEHDPALWGEIDARVARLVETLEVPDIPQLAGVAALRKAYRTLGKDPTRYRGSQEALIRRVLKGKGLYRINTVVDINNLVSLETFHSAGTFDVEQIVSPVTIRSGRPGETYYGIGRDLLNVEGLPLLADEQGPFGSPTSDSQRTMVTLSTRRIVTTILSFVGRGELPSQCRRMADLVGRYAQGQNVAIRVIP